MLKQMKYEILVENSAMGQQRLRLPSGWKCWPDDARKVKLCSLLRRIASQIMVSGEVLYR